MRALAASLMTAGLGMSSARAIQPWIVAYGAAGAAAMAVLPLYVLLGGATSSYSAMLVVLAVLAALPGVLVQRGWMSGASAIRLLLLHQLVLAIALGHYAGKSELAIVLPAFLGVLLLASVAGRAELLAAAAACLTSLKLLHGGVMPLWPHAADPVLSLMLLGLTAAPGLATALTFWHAAERSSSGQHPTDEANASAGVVNCLPQLVLQHNRTGNVTEVFGEGLSSESADQQGLMGGGLFNRVHVADRPLLLHTLDKARHHGGTHCAELRLREPLAEAEPLSPLQAAPAPSYRWVELRVRGQSASQSQAQNETIVCSALRDIHDHKEREEALLQARKEAELSNSAKTRFLASVTHELRTPLNAIIGFSELLKRLEEGSAIAPVTTEQRIEYATLIAESGQHLLDVVNDILDATKIEAGRFEINCEGCDILPILHSAVDMVRGRDANDPARIRLLVDGPLPEINADKRACKQIFLNLLSNAVKFSPDRKPIEVHVRRDADHLRVVVADRGIGIDSDDLGRVGEPFFRAAEAEELQTPGTGLGLSVVKGLVALHGGRIDIASMPGEGTEVTLLLPIAGPGHQPSTDSNVISADPFRSESTEDTMTTAQSRDDKIAGRAMKKAG